MAKMELTQKERSDLRVGVKRFLRPWRGQTGRGLSKIVDGEGNLTGSFLRRLRLLATYVKATCDAGYGEPEMWRFEMTGKFYGLGASVQGMAWEYEKTTGEIVTALGQVIDAIVDGMDDNLARQILNGGL